jgi:hypothetical protein
MNSGLYNCEKHNSAPRIYSFTQCGVAQSASNFNFYQTARRQIPHEVFIVATMRTSILTQLIYGPNVQV